MSNLTTKISHQELIHAWAPLMDVSIALDRLKEKAGSGRAGEIVGFMDDKVKRALEPLHECLARIERGNPNNVN